jgi:hypothetical protein
MKKMIGCLPNSPDYKHPQDRRRYIPYFQAKGIEYETADYNRDYDVLYVSLSADLNKWCDYKDKQLRKGKEVKVIFDLSDFYLVGGRLKDGLRSIFHYFSGRTKTLKSSYRNSVLKMIDNTDVLICGSLEQKLQLSDYHSRVVVVRDYFGNETSLVKSKYSLVKEGELNIVWEGLSHGNLQLFNMLRDIVKGVNDIKVRVHFITDSEYCSLGGKHLCKPTFSVLKKVFSGTDISFYHYDWNTITFSSVATSCDLALIPISNDPIMQQKPENKLLLFWSLGIPVIATNTKSYSRVMNSINEDYVCDSLEDWQRKITIFTSSQKSRENYMLAASKYVSEQCSIEAIVKTYEDIF